ncbi:MAG TPA: carboxypeptidase-like regulatory domain-containing protein, partial [Arenimonas sp.]|nr:carboxypeptidase-like regulatory domain-containing protein [Arenimonas sp.]
MTNRNRARLSKLSLGLALALAAAPAFAQTTSSAVGGRLVSGDGAPIAGAQVTITHVASGTSSNATTDAAGRYAARGLRVGGPYTVTFTKDGQTVVREGVYLPLATVAVVDGQIGVAATTTLAAVEVTGIAGADIFNPDNKGMGTSIS